MSKTKLETLLANTMYAQRGNTASIHRDNMAGYSIQIVVDVTAPAAITFNDAAVTSTGDFVVSAAHGYSTGLLVQLTTTGAVPGGLVKDTNYYIIVIDANTIQFANSRANALAGTALDITSHAGGGNHSTKVTALANLEFHLEQSIDGVNYYDVAGSTISCAADTSNLFGVTNPEYPYARVQWTLTAGQFGIVATAYHAGR